MVGRFGRRDMIWDLDLLGRSGTEAELDEDPGCSFDVALEGD